MRILGIDPGIKRTGFALADVDRNKLCLPGKNTVFLNNNYINLFESGLIKTSQNFPLDKKLEKIFENVNYLIKEFSPDVMVLEKLYSHYAYPATAIIMGHARGVIVLSAKISDVKVIDLPATKVKKSVTGKGNASKEQVSRMIRHIFNKNHIADYYDITDAAALILSYINMQAYNIKKIITKG